MNIWVGLSFVRLAIFLILGIMAYQFFPSQSPLPLYTLATLIFVWLVMFRFSNGRFRRRRNLLFSIGIYTQLILAGYSLTALHDEQFQPFHLSNHTGKIDFYSGVVCSDVQQKPNSTRFELAIEQVSTDGTWQKVSGKVLVYQPADAKQLPKYGDVLVAQGNITPVAPPSNPDEFDYRKYLANKQVYHQAFLYNAPYSILGNRPPIQT